MQLKSQIGHIECLNSATLSEFVAGHYKSPGKVKHIRYILPPRLRGVALYEHYNSTGSSGPHEVTSEILPSNVDLWYKLTTYISLGSLTAKLIDSRLSVS